MAEESYVGPANDYLICRSGKSHDYSLWRIDTSDEQLLQRLHTGGQFDRSHQLIPIGNYILEWGPIVRQKKEDGGLFPFRLLEFDEGQENPLAAEAVKEGSWTKGKFWGTREDFGNPDGAAKAFQRGDKLMLVPLGTFVLWVMPTIGRGSFKLFHFDPGSKQVLEPFPTSIAGSLHTVNFGHELISLGNYLLDRLPDGQGYSLFSVDPMDEIPLEWPPVQEGRWDDIDNDHQLIPIGDHVLDCDMKYGKYRLWRFDPKCKKLLIGPLRAGNIPDDFNGMTLTGIQGLRPIGKARKDVPGTIDFMRSKIKHVVYYMIENCSFDQVCGWLYEKGEGDVNFVGHRGPFQGAKPEMFNVDIDAENGPRQVRLSKWNEGQVPEDGRVEFLSDFDPYHDMTDVMRQYFFDGTNYDRDRYIRRVTPTMGGFLWNNGKEKVMWTYTPEQLPVLTGLAKAFAVSDEWFCSTPGATDANRAFAVTGSALRQLDNFMTGPQYINWPDAPHRASIWKVLWANGFKDWKIYYSMKWPRQKPDSPIVPRFVLTYHLFLKGQIPAVDAETSAYLDGRAEKSEYIATTDQFMDDARQGNLPAFSFLEPIWILGDKPATSYHPSAMDGKGPGERMLNEIYEALKAGPHWNETVLIITFDEHAGVFDHVPPPYAENPWPNDEVCGFRYDMMGPRVPTILVSPLIKEHTVFRSPTPVAYDSTSILATLLHWYGIPKGRWGLGERTNHAPTFEGVFQCQSPRSDKPSFQPVQARKSVIGKEDRASPEKLSELHELMTFRVVNSICGGRGYSAHRTLKIAKDILTQATDTTTLNRLIEDLADRKPPTEKDS
jgi:phospholipase C